MVVKNINAAQIDIPIINRGASVSGKTFVPRNGPHWPMIFSRTMPEPRLVSEPWLSRKVNISNQSHAQLRYEDDSLRAHGRILAIEGKTPQAAKKTPK